MSNYENSGVGPVSRFFKKEDVFTLPNLLSLLRLLMIPLIIWLYCRAGNHRAAVAIVVLSGLTDIADGFIARKFNMVSDLGKILDPIADKLTQAALIICLSSKYPLMLPLVCLLALKELCMLYMGYITIQRIGTVNSAKWYGKMSTVVLYISMAILILVPGVPLTAANVIICICGGTMLFSFFMYSRFYTGLWRGKIKPE